MKRELLFLLLIFSCDSVIMFNENLGMASKEIIEKIKSGKIRNQKELELEKIKIAKKFLLHKIPKNAEIFRSYSEGKMKDKKEDKEFEIIKKFLRIKPIRTMSGVANIAVMWLDKNDKFSCPGSCIYCPRGINAPQSYTGTEPATMRAQRYDYDGQRQVKNRIWQLGIIGHPTDKCELIVMGGTFPALQKDKQEAFIKSCLDAMNNRKSKSLMHAQKLNERAKHRCIGLTIETRPDYCSQEHINQMLKLGCTRVEIGVQCVDQLMLKKINRNHTVEDVINATRLLKNNGLKVTYHMMPGLTSLVGDRIDMKKELEQFKNIFSNPDFRPDELKVYPTLVLPGTKLYDKWKKGEYEAMTVKQITDLLIKIKQIVPPYVRIKRIMRDISHKEVVAGPSITNLRQLTLDKMEKLGIKCNCIRCREIKDKSIRKARLVKIEYEASKGKEIFLSFEDNNRLIGFLRLRFPDNNNNAFIRELHIYGPMAKIGEKQKDGKTKQHKSYGRILLRRAEEISKDRSKKLVLVNSGVGVRPYYRKLGYRLVGFYMLKHL